MASINTDDCKATFSLEPHDEAPERFFYVSGTVTHPAHGDVATLSGFALTRRHAWKRAGDFLELMDGESDEMMRFSTQVFDENMNVLAWLVDGGRRSGTGCWGRELNKGDIIYLQDMSVQKEFRAHGLGTWFLQQFLKAPQFLGDLPTKTHFFCWPAIGQSEGGTNEQVDSFFQKSGFRRIGRTTFMCYSPDPEHPSHQIAIADDATRLEDGFQNSATLTPDELRAQFPLHIEVASNDSPAIVEIIRVAYAADPLAIRKKAPDGLTPVHMAAGRHNLPALKKLLELGVGDDLQDAANSTGMTPLEMLDESMRSTRVFMQTMGIPWKGYSNEELGCQFLLKNALNVPGLPSTEQEYVTLNKFGLLH